MKNGWFDWGMGAAAAVLMGTGLVVAGVSSRSVEAADAEATAERLGTRPIGPHERFGHDRDTRALPCVGSRDVPAAEERYVQRREVVLVDPRCGDRSAAISGALTIGKVDIVSVVIDRERLPHCARRRGHARKAPDALEDAIVELLRTGVVVTDQPEL